VKELKRAYVSRSEIAEGGKEMAKRLKEKMR
jgi:hypothetical protein